MSTKTLLAVAAVLAIGSATSAMAQQQEYDRSGDHVFSYGPVMHQAPVVHETRTQRAAPPVTSPETARRDPTYDHIYYYGPVAH